MNEATLENLRRKSAFVDQVQIRDGVPLPSWIDINLTELCNRSAGAKRACGFCPRIDPAFYPNQKLHMSLHLAGKIAGDLKAIDYQGAVVLCGFGEPLLHPFLVELVSLFEGIRVEIVTNGDFLSPEKIAALSAAGCAFFVVSMYDGPEQRARFETMFAAAGRGDYLLRDRWHDESQDFGLKLTNRAGAVTAGNQAPVDTARPCQYLAYSMLVDWNGDALLCVQDWTKRVRFGNLAAQRLMDIWNAPAMHKRRMQLLRGDRSASPCNGCNVDGCLHGDNHAQGWLDAHGSDRARAVA